MDFDTNPNSHNQTHGHYFPSANEISKSARRNGRNTNDYSGNHDRAGVDQNYQTAKFMNRNNSASESSFIYKPVQTDY